MNIYGCDSVITTNLTIYPTYYHQQLFQICIGDSINIGDNYYDTAGIYIDSSTTVNGCDSLLKTEIIIEEPIAELSTDSPYVNLNIINGSIPLTYTIGNQYGTIITSSNNTGTDFVFTPSVNGTYYAIISDSLGCISDTVFLEVTFIPEPTFVSELKIKNLVIYPNPSRDIFNISFTSEEMQDLRVRVLSLVGEEITVEDLQQFVGEYIKKVNLNNFSKGLYFLEIETNKGIINKKLILQ
jgi:hypothetical protein